MRGSLSTWSRLIAALVAAPPAMLAQNPATIHTLDSSGAVIVQNDALLNYPAATVAPLSLVVLQHQRGPRGELFDPRNPFSVVKRMSDERIVALDLRAVHVFESNGRFLFSIDGPQDEAGELGQLEDVCVTRGDTLVVISYIRRRISVFDRLGRHLKTTETPGSIGPEACFEDGTILVRATRDQVKALRSIDVVPAARERDIVIRMHWSGKIVGRVAAYNSEDATGNLAHGVSAVAARNRVIVAANTAASYSVYSLDGRLTQIVRWASRGATRGRFNAPALAFRRIKADPAGRVWVEEFSSNHQDVVSWLVFDSNGRFIGHVLLPALGIGRTDLAGLGQNSVALAWRTPDGLRHFAIHSLQFGFP